MKLEVGKTYLDIVKLKYRVVADDLEGDGTYRFIVIEEDGGVMRFDEDGASCSVDGLHRRGLIKEYKEPERCFLKGDNQ